MKIKALLLLGVLAVAGMANTYYVSPTGNDATGTGTTTKPWKTISGTLAKLDALGATTSNDTISLADGTYSEKNVTFSGIRKGIFFKSKSNDYGKCTITFPTGAASSWIFKRSTTAQLKPLSFSGITFLGGALTYTFFNMDGHGSTPLRFDNCRFTDFQTVNNGAAFFYGCRNLVFDNCSIDNNVGAFAQSSDSITITNSSITNNTTSGSFIFGVSAYKTYVSLQSDTISHNSADGLFEHVELVANNVLVQQNDGVLFESCRLKTYMDSCYFSQNTGLVFSELLDSSATLKNSKFTSNSKIYHWLNATTYRPNITNCTFTGKQTIAEGGFPLFTQSLIIADPTMPLFKKGNRTFPLTLQITWSNVTGLNNFPTEFPTDSLFLAMNRLDTTGLSSMITANSTKTGMCIPESFFVDSSAGDFRLLSYSPLVDYSGSNDISSYPNTTVFSTTAKVGTLATLNVSVAKDEVYYGRFRFTNSGSNPLYISSVADVKFSNLTDFTMGKLTHSDRMLYTNDTAGIEYVVTGSSVGKTNTVQYNFRDSDPLVGNSFDYTVSYSGKSFNEIWVSPLLA